MDLSGAFVLFALTMAITPGPNNTMLLASGLNHGVRRSLPHLVGINLGFTLMVIAVGLGLGSVFEALPLMHRVIKLVGILYLAYLAWLIGSTNTKNVDRGEAKPLSFWQAGLFQWVNPKAWVMITGAIAAYTSPSVNIHVQVFVIAGIFLLVGTPCSAIWLFGGASLQRILKSRKHQAAFNITMALLLLTSIYPVARELIIQWWG